MGNFTKPMHQRFSGKYIDQINPDKITKNSTATQIKSITGNQPEVDEMHQLSAGAWSLIEAKRLQNYLANLVNKILITWPYKVPPIKVFVVSTDLLTAYATPAGHIFISLGFLDAIESEDELAFILAHEASHIALNHHYRINFIQRQQLNLERSLRWGTTALALTNMKIDKNSQGIKLVEKDRSKTRKNLVKAATIFYTSNEALGTVVDPIWSRNQEFESDLLGFDLLNNAEYNPSAALSVLRKLEAIEDSEIQTLREQRNKEIVNAFMQVLTAYFKRGSENARQVAQIVLKSQLIRFGQQLQSKLKASHPPASKRGGFLGDYYRREYRAQTVLAEFQTNNFNRAMNHKATKPWLDNHRYALQAKNLLLEGNLDQAVALGLKSLGYPTSNAPYPRFIMYLIRKSQGNHSKAIKNLEIVAQTPNVPIAVKLALADEYSYSRQTTKAIKLLNKVEQQSNNKEIVLPYFITAYGKKYDIETAQAYYLQCRQSSDQKLSLSCSARWAEVDPERRRT